MDQTKKDISFFDFDGTITTRDSFLEMIRFTNGTFKFIAGFGLLSPWILAMKFNLLSNSSVKEKVIRHFFGNTHLVQFEKACKDFSLKKIPSIVRPGALDEIKKLQSAGAHVVVVSASPENYLKPWCDSIGVSLIGTRLEIKQDRITGRIAGNNCYGQEKVSRIQEQYHLSDYQNILVFGDSPGDLPMMALATHSYYKPFRN